MKFRQIFQLLIAVMLALNTGVVFAQDDITLGYVIGANRKLGAQTSNGQQIVGVLGIDSDGNTKIFGTSGTVFEMERSLVPDANSDDDLGTAALSWEDLFVEKILADNDSTSDLDADAVTGFTAKPLVSIVGTSLTQSHLGLVQNVASAQGAEIAVLKTRAAAGSTNANTIIVSGDDVLAITAKGANGASYDPLAQLLFESGGTPGASADMPGRIRALISPDGSATLTEIMDLSATSAVEFFARADAQRLWALDGSSDTVMTLLYGDGGTTAAQTGVFGPSTADADDDSITYIGTAASVTRGGYIAVKGNEASGAGDVSIEGGDADGSNLLLRTNHANSTMTISTGNATVAATIEADQDILMTGDLYLADGQNFGFTAASGANTACDTTCTTGCVAGWDTGTSVFVACSNAIADTCLCTK